MSELKAYDHKMTDEDMKIVLEIFKILARENPPFEKGLSLLVMCVIESVRNGTKGDEKQILADLTMDNFRVQISKV